LYISLSLKQRCSLQTEMLENMLERGKRALNPNLLHTVEIKNSSKPIPPREKISGISHSFSLSKSPMIKWVKYFVHVKNY